MHALAGIQYAEHPVGDLRWQPPVRKTPWAGVVDARSFGADCINAPLFDNLNSITALPMSESCLYLNVWAPANATASDKLPVMLWIHGGSFTSGGSTTYETPRSQGH